MSATEHDWQRIAKVAMGLQGDDPINWPHYADEAKALVEENESMRQQLTGAADRAKTLEASILAAHEALWRGEHDRARQLLVDVWGPARPALGGQ